MNKILFSLIGLLIFQNSAVGRYQWDKSRNDLKKKKKEILEWSMAAALSAFNFLYLKNKEPCRTTPVFKIKFKS